MKIIKVKIKDIISKFFHISKPAWKKWNDFTVMERDFRFKHKSHKVITDYLLKEFNLQNFSFLDCGVLSAVTYRKLKEAALNVEYSGADIGDKIITDCKKRFPEVDWHVRDVQDLKFPDSSFDVVNIRHVLEHLPHYEKAIKEARRVTKKIALFCLFYPLQENDELNQKIKSGGIYHYNKYGRDAFINLLKKEFSSFEEIYIKDSQRDNQLFICKI